MAAKSVESGPFSKNQMPRDQIFISYSHHDKRWLDELTVTLAPLLRRQSIVTWDDTKIRVGTRWKAEITAALERAKVAVLLVSRRFLASDFIASSELPSLLEAADQSGLVIVWIAVGYSLYEHTEITDYQAANDPSKPLNSLSDFEVDRELVRIAKILDSLMSVPRGAADSTGVVSEASTILDQTSYFDQRAISSPSAVRPDPPTNVSVDKPQESVEHKIAEIVQRLTKDFPETSIDEHLSPAQQRLHTELADGRWAWRSIHAISGKAGIEEAAALELLRADPQVELGRAKSGKIIARLKKRDL